MKNTSVRGKKGYRYTYKSQRISFDVPRWTRSVFSTAERASRLHPLGDDIVSHCCFDVINRKLTSERKPSVDFLLYDIYSLSVLVKECRSMRKKENPDFTFVIIYSMIITELLYSLQITFKHIKNNISFCILYNKQLCKTLFLSLSPFVRFIISFLIFSLSK